MVKTLACIGVGNMASAILGALAQHPDPENPVRLVVYDRLASQYERLAAVGAADARRADSAADAARAADYLLLAVKPQNVGEVLGELSAVDFTGKTILSICAGISTGSICRMLGRAVPVVRIMPNTPLSLGYGVTALARNGDVSDEAYDFACAIFDRAGMTLRLDESQMNAVICVNGSSPAYFYYFIDAMVKSAKAQGLDCEGLVEAVCRTMIGSAEMLMRSGKTPEELIRAVTSPKGTTEKAMEVLMGADVAGTIHEAMAACTKRAEELSRDFG